MKIEAQSDNRDREATTARFGLAAFVIAELLCTGALVVWAFFLWESPRRRRVNPGWRPSTVRPQAAT